jgi:hypothetical protein
MSKSDRMLSDRDKERGDEVLRRLLKTPPAPRPARSKNPNKKNPGRQKMIEIDPDVAEAALLLQSKFEVGKLSGIAQSLADLAPALWGRYPNTEIAPAHLIQPGAHSASEPKAAIQ